MHLALIRTSPAAIAPLARYYAEREPEWRLTHLLDHAILHLFRDSREDAAGAALASLVERAAGYGDRAAMLTVEALFRVIDFAAEVGAGVVNIGTLRGQLPAGPSATQRASRRSNRRRGLWRTPRRVSPSLGYEGFLAVECPLLPHAAAAVQAAQRHLMPFLEENE